MFRVICFSLMLLPAVGFGQTREEKVRNDRAKVESEGFWIYNDLPRAFREAKQTGKPILVVLRCIPCEECVKLDDDLIDQDPELQPLLKQFVCARQVSTNGLDLDIFQFDTDQSFAAFMLNADGSIYGRFGTRSHRTEWLGDVSLKGLARALQGALDLHRDYPNNRAALAGKRGEPMEVASPEQYPSLKAKYTATLNYQGDVVKSCIHCHQIGDAQRQWYRSKRQPIPDQILFPYPHPKSIGLILDADEKATVKKVETDSLAAQSGFQTGDRIETLAGQPLLSIADVQWVLHGVAPQGGQVSAEVMRNGRSQKIVLTLPDGWRQLSDISWRVTSWGLRRMATGGLLLEELPAEERRRIEIPDESMALRVKHVGQYGAHAAAKRAGFQQGDVIIEFDGRRDLRTDTDILRYGVTARRPGERVTVRILRDRRERTLTLPMQP